LWSAILPAATVMSGLHSAAKTGGEKASGENAFPMTGGACFAR